ncbi:MAG: alpha-galactosidase [Ruminococcaceae bacterium]|nr:alpha-galactosidase [Oscillospiraceae bacterium]
MKLIRFDEERRIFHLTSGDSSYIMGVNAQNFLIHGYWGRKLPDSDFNYLMETQGHSSFEACEDNEVGYWHSPNCMRMEFPVTGRQDVKKTALELKNADGTNMLDLRYQGYKIHEGKPGLPGLPATYETEKGQAETLEVILLDDHSNIEVSVFYSVWAHLNAICRWAVVKNNGNTPVMLERVMSGCVDFPDRDYIMTTNYGAWANERQIEKHRLFSGVQGLYSRKGTSSHMHNPFVILQRPTSDEYQGDVYGAVLAYSGNYEAVVDVDSYGMSRMILGINPDGFTWKLEPGETFTTPELCLAYSYKGVNGMSNTFHKLFRDHMARGKYKNTRRPVLLNTWEGCYFGINEELIENIAKEAAKLGVELLVVDDGWFGERNNDMTSLGDWYPNKAKLPNGVEGMAKKVNAAGVDLGIWFEPEMISKESQLYKKHPEWTLCVKGRLISQGRNQYVLDMSRQDVQDYLYDCIADTIKKGNITYVKWDYNRNHAEIGSELLPADRQGEVGHRYVLGLYALMERLVTNFPDVLFESCSGGGGRFDAGLLYYMPQAWTSDDTDAIMRLSIQYGTSLVYPLSSMSAHISVCPNHQTWRSVSYKTRQDVAYTGSFGFELDPLKLSEEERAQMAATAEDYKSYGDLFVNGDYYRLANIYDDKCSAWMFVSPEKDFALVTHASIDVNIEGPQKKFKLYGLDENATYVDEGRGRIYSGAALMYDGLPMDGLGDRATATYKLKKM